MQMRVFLALIILVLSCGIVFGATGDVTVYSLKVYEENTRIDGDFGSSEFTVEPGKVVEFQVRLNNPYNISVDVEFDATLLDIADDIIREESIDVGTKSRSDAVVFEYFIPADTRETTVKWILKYTYTAHGTSYEFSKEYDINIERKKLTSDDILLNLTRTIVGGKEQSDKLIATVTELTQSKSNCESELGTLKESVKNNEEFKVRYFQETNSSRDFESKFSSCDAEKRVMYTQGQLDDRVKTEVNSAKRQQKKEDDNFLLTIAVGAGVWYYFKRKQKTVGGGGEGKPLTGTWK